MTNTDLTAVATNPETGAYMTASGYHSHCERRFTATTASGANFRIEARDRATAVRVADAAAARDYLSTVTALTEQFAA